VFKRQKASDFADFILATDKGEMRHRIIRLIENNYELDDFKKAHEATIADLKRNNEEFRRALVVAQVALDFKKE
jgi:hypothetical protein